MPDPGPGPWRVPFCPDCGQPGRHADTCTMFPGEIVEHGNYEWVALYYEPASDEEER